MSAFQRNITRHTERHQFGKTEQASKPESHMTGRLGLSDQEFFKNMIHMLKT